ncbi:MAG: thiol-disulfide oxidoreductase DCC [Acidobacteria bacterium]|nr:MAG: thiol-disulfide oxidoreductase DCC [Acidobacteriota bacterium]
MSKAILLYDGVCGLCNRGVQFILRHDSKASFRFASLQSEFAKRVLERHGVRAADLDTVYVVENSGAVDESLLARSDAAMFVLRELGGFWRLGAWFLGWLPRGVRDWGYALVARNRYRVFGRYESCPIPSERDRARFLDV